MHACVRACRGAMHARQHLTRTRTHMYPRYTPVSSLCCFIASEYPSARDSQKHVDMRYTVILHVAVVVVVGVYGALLVVCVWGGGEGQVGERHDERADSHPVYGPSVQPVGLSAQERQQAQGDLHEQQHPEGRERAELVRDVEIWTGQRRAGAGVDAGAGACMCVLPHGAWRARGIGIARARAARTHAPGSSASSAVL